MSGLFVLWLAERFHPRKPIGDGRVLMFVQTLYVTRAGSCWPHKSESQVWKEARGEPQELRTAGKLEE